jgi:undecaprenyl-diphosphatase
MEFIQIILLALVQGITEFLPISSSGHLIIAPYLFGYTDQGLAFDIAVHVGSLLAVIIYFRNQILVILKSFIGFGNNSLSKERKLGKHIIIATLPIVFVGLLFHQHVANDLRSLFVIAMTTVGFGFLLLAVDANAQRTRDEYSMNWIDALIVGLFQSIAIIPGTSRSGITMTAGLILGLTRESATRFSFLLSIPTILMSGAMATLDLMLSGKQVAWNDLFIGVMLSFAAAYLCIHLFLKFIENIGMLPFVIYRLLLGGFLFFLLYR